MNTKWKVITAVMTLITIICTIFFILLLKNSQNSMNRFITSQAASIRAIAETIEQQKSSQYRKRIKSLINYKTSPTREKMVEAFARQDREDLYQRALPFFKVLRQENPHFSTFGWVLPNNHAFVRIHNPPKFGEDVSKMRPDIVAANHEKQQFAGYTAGYKGLQYRIVQPVTYKGKHLGTIQFGLADAMLLDAINAKLHMPVGIVMPDEIFSFIKRSRLPHKKCENGYTVQSRDITLFESKHGHLDWQKKEQRTTMQGREYVVVKVLELFNFNYEKQGDIFVALNISKEVGQQRTLILYTIALTAILLIASFVILYSSYGTLLEKVVSLNQSLEKANSDLEKRVKERTADLQLEMEERYEAEKQRMKAEERAQRASKMEAIGLMAGGVAHDLNNILSGITSYPELLLLQLSPESKMRPALEAIQDSGLRAATVVEDLLTVARGVASEKHPTNLNILVEEYFSSPEYLKKQQWHSKISCRQDLLAEPATIFCSAVHVKKCLMNLINNSIEALDTSGEVMVASYNEVVTEEASKQLNLQPGKYVVLTVHDTGKGVSAADQKYIFEPFYTKKMMGQASGTGLGLTIVWNTMQDHDGTVTISSSEHGTTFTLYFPLSEQKVALPSQIPLADLQGQGQFILVVDDEPRQREITSQMVESLGYRCSTVASGEEAITFLQTEEADLIILDMIMNGGIDGQQTYNQILQTNPKQRAIIASGFSENRGVKKTLQHGASAFISKPFTLQELGIAIKKAFTK